MISAKLKLEAKALHDPAIFVQRGAKVKLISRNVKCSPYARSAKCLKESLCWDYIEGLPIR